MWYGGEEVKLSISCPFLFLENWGSVCICETAVSRKSTLCQAAVLLPSEGDGSKGQSRWWSQRALQLELSVSEEDTGYWWRWWSCRPQKHKSFMYFFFFNLLTSISNDWRGRVGRAWAVFQDGFSDMLRTMIVSHFLCLYWLPQLPCSEIWTSEMGHREYYRMEQITSALEKKLPAI